MLDAYDQVRIINLQARADRRKEMRGELRRLCLDQDQRVEFFAAIAPSDVGHWTSLGAHGCFISHLFILKEALAANASVLILEDDCDFTDAAKGSDWGETSDIFYGGFGASDYSDLQATQIQGSHCMGFSRTVVQSLVAFLEELAKTESPPPIDGAYVEFRRANPQFTTKFALPQVAVQRQSPSDIVPGRFDKHKWLRLTVGLARKLNRARYRRRKMMDGL